MIAVLDSPAMREADRVTIAELGLPSLVLMESAAAAVADLVAERFPGVGRIAVACGPGNNGGDGLAMARLLRCRGFDVGVGMLVARRSLKGDAAVQLELARRFGVPVSDCSRGGTARLAELLGGADVVVDALFGTGLDRPLTGRWAEAVSVVNRAGAPVVAVDLPSGLLGSSAGADGPSVRADLTVTFAAPKVAHVLPPACWRCGEVAVAAIGIPPWVADARMSLGLVEAEDVAGWLPRRGPDAYKGTFGHLLVVAGREGRAGAAALAARAAVRMGAGLVTVATTGAAGAAVQALAPEAMVDLLEAGEGGEVAGGGIEGSLAKATAVAVGPGLGTGDGPRRLLGSILERWRGPLLLDADALTLLAGRLGTLRTRAVTPVLTPHPGELARLLGVATSEVTADRLGAACRAAEAGGAVVLAKGARTVIAGGGGVALVNPTGTSGLASGGAGDVLSGVVGALLAQWLAAREAAASGAYLHGRAAELAGERFPGAVPAGELVGYLAAAEAEVGQAG
ncbi:MAG: NAD(P)H-hydrate dehydratase [Thermoanaerobaculaceae bacterium]|nr:NAD(P)H-hydrate dehydratase [Thermoanaerobaculaceae bacterium]